MTLFIASVVALSYPGHWVWSKTCQTSAPLQETGRGENQPALLHREFQQEPRATATGSRERGLDWPVIRREAQSPRHPSGRLQQGLDGSGSRCAQVGRIEVTSGRIDEALEQAQWLCSSEPSASHSEHYRHRFDDHVAEDRRRTPNHGERPDRDLERLVSSGRADARNCRNRRGRRVHLCADLMSLDRPQANLSMPPQREHELGRRDRAKLNDAVQPLAAPPPPNAYFSPPAALPATVTDHVMDRLSPALELRVGSGNLDRSDKWSFCLKAA